MPAEDSFIPVQLFSMLAIPQFSRSIRYRHRRSGRDTSAPDRCQGPPEALRASGPQKPATGPTGLVSVRLVITDAVWHRIEPPMPLDPVRGRRWADHRRTLEAIAWKYRTCSPWRNLPEELEPFQTAHKRLLRWAVDGTWERILAAVFTEADAGDDVGRAVSVDSTVCRAHQHSAGARKRGRPTGPSRRITRSDAPAVA